MWVITQYCLFRWFSNFSYAINRTKIQWLNEVKLFCMAWILMVSTCHLIFVETHNTLQLRAWTRMWTTGSEWSRRVSALASLNSMCWSVVRMVGWSCVWRSVGIWKFSVFSTQFCCDPKIAPKNEVYLYTHAQQGC